MVNNSDKSFAKVAQPVDQRAAFIFEWMYLH